MLATPPIHPPGIIDTQKTALKNNFAKKILLLLLYACASLFFFLSGGNFGRGESWPMCVPDRPEKAAGR